MDFTSITVEILSGLNNIVGNYGLAIIVLTLVIRIAMWPLGVSQQKSMRKMQELQPKMKEIQNRYKSNPQMMQSKMMEFYKEHSFNPFGGCFPMLIQLPVFFMLYAALISPQFINVAGESNFLFVNRLDSTLQSRAGAPNDGVFAVEKGDIFEINKTVKVYTKDGKTIEDIKIDNPKKDIKIQGEEITPGSAIDFKILMDKLKLPFEQLEKVEKIEASVFNTKTKELENIEFNRQNSLLIANVPTEKVDKKFHFDVFILIVLFAGSMVVSQKLMMKSNAAPSTDPTQRMMQEQMSKMMPIMITVMFIFFPIPAGVLLYMVVSNLFQVVQSYVINKQVEMESQTAKPTVSSKSSADLSQAKKVEVKEIKDNNN